MRSFTFLESFLRRELDLSAIPEAELEKRINARIKTGTFDEICKITKENFSLDVGVTRLDTTNSLGLQLTFEMLEKFSNEIGVKIVNKEFSNDGALLINDPQTGYNHMIAFSLENGRLLVTIEYIPH